MSLKIIYKDLISATFFYINYVKKLHVIFVSIVQIIIQMIVTIIIEIKILIYILSTNIV